MQCSGAGLDGTFIEHDAIRFDTLYPTAADDVFYPPQLLKFGLRHRSAAIHGGPHVLVKAQQMAFGLDTREEISNRSRIGDRFKIVAYKTANRLSKHLACLDVSTIHKPRIARHDPSDVIRIDIVLQQKQARIH